MNAVKADILNSSLHSQTPETANANVNHLTKEYNSILQEVINRHAPEVSRSIFLRPNAPWFNDSLRALKREKRKCEHKYLTTGLEIHRQIFRDKCRTYTTTLNSV
jgi:nicotinamide riboside kinase